MDMDKIKETLIKTGLSNSEVSIYLTILQNGPISAGKTAQISGNYKANTYQIISKLKDRGLLMESKEGNTKVYESLSPNILLDKINETKSDLEQIMPILSSIQKENSSTSLVKVIKGMSGWKNLLHKFLEIGEERVVYGVPKEAKILVDYMNEYHKERGKRKITLRHLYNFDARERIKQTNKMPYTESKYLPKEFDQPVATSICGSLIVLTVYEKDNFLTLVIDNEKIAKAYKKHFEYLWTLGKKEF